MKLLLDESVPRRLKQHFPPGFEVSTVQENGWSATKNGQLLKLAAESYFDALITADRGFEYQHNPATLPLTVIILISHRTTFGQLLPLVPKVVELVGSPKGIYSVRA